jgi:hypothetical protein
MSKMDKARLKFMEGLQAKCTIKESSFDSQASTILKPKTPIQFHSSAAQKPWHFGKMMERLKKSPVYKKQATAQAFGLQTPIGRKFIPKVAGKKR